MAALKHIIEIRKAVDALGIDVVPAGCRGHFQMRDRESGAYVATVAGSPTDRDNTVKNAVKDALRWRAGGA